MTGPRGALATMERQLHNLTPQSGAETLYTHGREALVWP